MEWKIEDLYVNIFYMNVYASRLSFTKDLKFDLMNMLGQSRFY